MELTPERKLKLEGWLEEAEAAYQEAATYGQIASTSHGNSASNTSVAFQGVSPENIRRRINELRAELGMESYNQLRPHVPLNYGSDC